MLEGRPTKPGKRVPGEEESYIETEEDNLMREILSEDVSYLGVTQVQASL